MRGTAGVFDKCGELMSQKFVLFEIDCFFVEILFLFCVLMANFERTKAGVLTVNNISKIYITTC